MKPKKPKQLVKNKRPYKRKLIIKEIKMTPEQQQAIVDFLTPIQAVSGGTYSVTFTPPPTVTPITFTVPA